MRWFSSWMGLASLVFAGAAPPGKEQPKEAFVEGYGGHRFCVSRDGKRLAINCWGVWDIPNRKRLFGGSTRGAWGMSFSPDGKLLTVVGNYSEFYVYDASDGKVYWDLTLTGHGDTVLSHVEFTPDSKYMVSASGNGMLRVWDVQKKKARALFCFPSTQWYGNRYKEYLDAWRAVAGDKPPDGVETYVVFDKKVDSLRWFTLSPDGITIAVPLGSTAEVMLLDWATGKVKRTVRTDQDSTLSVCYSRDGKLLAVGGGGGGPDDPKWRGTIEVWDVASWKRLVTCKAHKHSVLHMAFSPDGKLLASGGTVDGVRVWDVATGKQRYALHQEKVFIDGQEWGDPYNAGVAFLPDGKALLTLPYAERGPVHFWEPHTGKRIPQLANSEPAKRRK